MFPIEQNRKVTDVTDPFSLDMTCSLVFDGLVSPSLYFSVGKGLDKDR